MTALGKRYIAVWECLGPADEGRQWAEDMLYGGSPGHTVTNQRRVGTLIVDLDALPRTDFTDEQLAMHHDRRIWRVHERDVERCQ